MNKRHLSVAVVAVLALSSSTIASAEGGSHRRIGGYEHIESVAPIGLSNTGGVLTIDTSTATPSFLFDTTTVTPHIDFDPSKLMTHFDTSTATNNFDDEPGVSDDGVGEDDSLPAGNSTVSPVIPPAAPGTPPTTPSWITKPHAKSNDDGDHSDHSSEDSQD
jgi:hypothetical protein